MPRSPSDNSPAGRRRAASSTPLRLHRIREVRRKKRISLEAVAEELELDVDTVLRQEAATFDLPISALLRWQQVLDASLNDLLVDEGSPLGSDEQQHQRLLSFLRTAREIRAVAQDPAVVWLADNLVGQTLELLRESRD